jgi:membrane protein YdbS with pleckstrin-like domain
VLKAPPSWAHPCATRARWRRRVRAPHTCRVRHRSISALFGLRILLVSNIVLVTAIGALCLIYYQRPEGYLFAAAAWCVVAMLVSLVRFTDPYRQPPVRHRRSEAR